MAHIVDDKDNIRRFMEAMSNVAGRFTDGRYGHSPSTTLRSPAVSTVASPITENADLEALGNTETSVTMTSQKMMQSTEKHGEPLPPLLKDCFGIGTQELSPTMQHDESWNGHRTGAPVPPDADSAVSRQLQSPQLSGLRAPPSTPETSAHDGHQDGDDIEEIVGTQLGKVLADKSRPVGLGDSRFAPQRLSPLNRRRSGSSNTAPVYFTTPNNKLSDAAKRQRNESFARQSFVIASRNPPLNSTNTSSYTNHVAHVHHGEEGLKLSFEEKPTQGQVGEDCEKEGAPQRTPHDNGKTDLLPQTQWQTEQVVSKVEDPWHDPSIDTWESSEESSRADDAAEEQKNEATEKERTASPARPKHNTAPPASTSIVDEMQAKIMAFQSSRSFCSSSGTSRLERTSSEETVVPTVRPSTPRPHIPPALSYSQSELMAMRPKEPFRDGEKRVAFETSAASSKKRLSAKSRPVSAEKLRWTAADDANLPPHLRLPAHLKNGIPPQGEKAKLIVSTSPPDVGLFSAPLRPQPIKTASDPHLVIEEEDTERSKEALALMPTPSSEIFELVSPATASHTIRAATASIAAAAAGNPNGDLFLGKSWGTPEKREASASQVRKVILTRLPDNVTPKFVASLVYGGALENIMVTSSMASVRFLDHNDCMKFYDATSNGLVYGKKGGEELFVYVELSKDVDVIGGLLKGYIEQGFTRSIRVIGADDHWSSDDLKRLAGSKNRKVEHIEDGKSSTGHRLIDFRFCDIGDAVSFKTMIARDEDWEPCNIKFGEDPCATATGVHFD